jgi:hypothetical protein
VRGKTSSPHSDLQCGELRHAGQNELATLLCASIQICHQLGLAETLSPPQLCETARAELGMANAAVPLVQNFAEIMTHLGLSLYK